MLHLIIRTHITHLVLEPNPQWLLGSSLVVQRNSEMPCTVCLLPSYYHSAAVMEMFVTQRWAAEIHMGQSHMGSRNSGYCLRLSLSLFLSDTHTQKDEHNP